ncbi:MAG: DUF488 domain-containing protein [Syntrophorhabdaceae bacterium]|nr:DUF488 domain-containing protein [Syntrophorhabdaceae bacterium]
MIRVKRIYEDPSHDDGVRILVDRLWPRGLSREEAKVDLWLKEIAPSDALRKWFGHDETKWTQFQQRYFRELDEKGEILESVSQMLTKRVTLLYGAKDQQHNNAVALKEYLTTRGGRIGSV